MNEIITQTKDGFVFQSFDGNGMNNGNMPEIQDCLKRLVKSTDVFIDLGAHIGTMSIPVVAATKPKLAIFVEANPNVIPLLEENCRINLPDQKFIILNKAVCDTDEIVDFWVNEGKADSSSMAREDMKSGRITRVQGARLDTLVKDIEGEIVMKIDIELAESLMWKGAILTLPKIREIVIEWFMGAMELEHASTFLGEIRASKFLLATLDGKYLEDEEILKFAKEDLWLRNSTL